MVSAVLLTEASITAHQRQKRKQNEAKTNKHQPARDEPAPSLLKRHCLNGISSIQIALAGYPDDRSKVDHRIAN